MRLERMIGVGRSGHASLLMIRMIDRMSGGAFTLTGGLWAGSSEPVNPCLADYTDDGAVDGDDVIAFFADWDFGDLAADVSRDGGVDGDDVILFFERWDAGC